MADASHGGSPIDPLSQFEIKPIVPIEIFGLDVSFTNSALYMVISLVVVAGFMMMATRGRALVPGRMQSVAEMSYEFIAGIVRDNAGTAGLQYFPLIFTFFTFILACNLLGLTPYAFTVTSHIIVTGALGLFAVGVVTAIGFARHGLGFLRLFAPSGLPTWIMPIIVPIEVISYLIRPLSLSVRLFANMVAGHMVLKVFAGFIVMMGVAMGWVPFIVMIAVNALEVLIGFLQAYVFAMLVSIYLNDALHLHDH
ncbi:MAG: F0F1 ATP synthase subunit A [Pseudomonadota bacterium]